MSRAIHARKEYVLMSEQDVVIPRYGRFQASGEAGNSQPSGLGLVS